MRYRWHSHTNQLIEVVRSMDDRDVPPTQEELYEEGIIGYKPEEFSRRPESPLIPRSHEKPREQGFRHPTKGEIKDQREVRHLEMDAMDLPLDQRDDIETEIAKLEGFEDD